MRRIVTGAALAALTLALVVPGSPAHAATGSPSLTIATPGPLADQQRVTLTGSGLTPGDTLAFMECQSYGDLCTYATDASGTVDASGRLTLSATAHRYIDDYMGILPRLDCAYEDCGFAFVRRGDYEDGYLVVAETVGHFSRAQPPSPSATIEAAAPLPAVVTTRVLGHGFVPGTEVYASRCRVSAPDPSGRVGEVCLRGESATADARGDVAVPVELRRIAVDSGIDCVEEIWLCSVRLDGPAYGATARVPLTFDPTSFPPPAPTITVTPQPVRHVAATITVTGRGFRPAHVVTVSGPGGSTTATADASGGFTTTLEIHRYVEATGTYDPVIDCANAGACAVTASTGPDDLPASVPVTFAARSDDPTLVLDGATVQEGNGESPASFRVHLDRPASVPVEFWILVGFNGQDPDLHTHFAVETIPAGRTELSVPFTVYGDRLDEPDHHTGFAIVELTGAQLAGRPLVPITVRDDDPAPALRVGSTTVRETDGPQFVSVGVTLNAPSGRDVTVDWVTRHDTARASVDYVRLRGTLVIPAGQRRGTITVAVLGDRVHEASERFHVTLDDPVHATIADGDAFVTIHDDD